jgi:hypothetical protein
MGYGMWDVRYGMWDTLGMRVQEELKKNLIHWQRFENAIRLDDSLEIKSFPTLTI